MSNPTSTTAGLRSPPPSLRWLRLVRGHLVAAHLAITAFTFVAFNVIFLWTNSHLSLPEQFGLELAGALVSLLIPTALTAVALRHEVSLVFGILEGVPAHQVGLWLRLVKEELVDLKNNLDDLRFGGERLESAKASEWVARRIFAITRGRYVGIDNTLPSRFRGLYDDYLNAQLAYLSRTAQASSCRIFILEPSDLEQDGKSSPDDIRWLRDWHDTNKVRLVFCTPQDAAECADRLGLDVYLNIAYWDSEAALLWLYERDVNYVRLRLALSGENSFRKCHDYVERLEACSVEIEEFCDQHNLDKSFL